MPRGLYVPHGRRDEPMKDLPRRPKARLDLPRLIAGLEDGRLGRSVDLEEWRWRRALFQNEHWIDPDGMPHEIADLSPAMRAAARADLRARGSELLAEVRSRLVDEIFRRANTGERLTTDYLDVWGRLSALELARRRFLLSGTLDDWIGATSLGRAVFDDSKLWRGFQRVPVQPVLALSDVDHGSYQISTLRSEYRLDLDARYLIRQPRAHRRAREGSPVRAASFDDRGRRLPWEELVSCHVGLPIYILTARGQYENRAAWVRSSPITQITPVDR